MTALTNGVPVSDVTLIGNVIRIAGSDNDSGTGTFAATSLGQSRVDLDLGGGKRSEIRNLTNGMPSGAWISTAGTITPIALHNCWTDAAWFFPALSSLANSSNPTYNLTYVGPEQHGEVNTVHIRVSQTLAQDPDNDLLVPRLSTMDFYLDPATSLPLAVAFNVHPDGDLIANIPAEIRFADYRAVSGVQVPFHVQRMLNGVVTLDVVIMNASLNSGISPATFSIQ